MKIIVVDHGLTACTHAPEDALWPLYMKPDSALLKDGKPFFVPDEGQRVMAEPHVVFRIGRLGKSIPQRFAHRYYDAVTLGMNLMDTDANRKCREAGWPWDMGHVFDGSAVIGQWKPIEDVRQPFALKMEVNGKVWGTYIDTEALQTAEKVIAYLSRTVTLKMGDLIYAGAWAPAVELTENDRISGSLNGENLLNFYIR